MTRTVLRSAVRVIVVCAVLLPLLLALGVATDQLRTTTLLTGSMSPELPAGTFLLERPVAAQDVRAGDVITYTVPGGDDLVTHRVVDTEQDDQGRLLATTRGDANDDVDGWRVVLSGQPVWTVRWHVVGAGGVTTALRELQPVVGVGVVVLPLLLLVSVLRTIWRDDERREPVDDADTDDLDDLDDDELDDDGLAVFDGAGHPVGATA